MKQVASQAQWKAQRENLPALLQRAIAAPDEKPAVHAKKPTCAVWRITGYAYYWRHIRGFKDVG